MNLAKQLPLMTCALIVALASSCATSRRPDVPTEPGTHERALAQSPSATVPLPPGDLPVCDYPGLPLPRPFRAIDVFFEFDHASVREDQAQALAHNLTFLLQFSSIKVLVEGHCDDRGTSEYNMALGERRAATVRDYLVRSGLHPARVQTISYGKERPFSPGQSEEARAQNRRAHFVFSR